jgi:hypothetical protein
VIGYAVTFASAGIASTNLNATLSPQSIPNGLIVMPPPLPSNRVLIADATLRSSGIVNADGTAGAGASWTDIPGGFPMHHMSPHVEGTVPAGGNVACLDAHVEWRPFSIMRMRSASGGTPQFWW